MSLSWKVFKKDIGVVTSKLKPGCLLLLIRLSYNSESFVIQRNDISVSGFDDNC